MPLSSIDLAAPLVRHAHCDGSVRLGHTLPRDLEPSTLAGWIRLIEGPGVVVCMETAFLLHVGGAGYTPGPVDVVGTGSRLPLERTHTFAFTLAPSEVTTVDGVRATTPERTLVDLARLAPLARAADALIWARPVLNPEAVAQVVAAQRGLHRITRARQLIMALWPEVLG
nr:hypothetical protein [Actinomycetales bacterium]